MQDAPPIKISPRAVLESLSHRRIQPNRISFPENGTRKQGGSASVELAILSLDPAEQSSDSTDTLLVAVKKFRFGDNKANARVLANVIQLLGFADDTEDGIAWMILPWEANGNVREFLNYTSLEIPERVSLIYDISCGVEYLHTTTPPIRHGDLKSANILVNSENRAVITDFGSARFIEEPTLPKARVQTATMISAEPLVDMQASNTTSLRVELKSLETLITLTGTAWTLRWAAPELIMTGNLPFHDETNDYNLVCKLVTRDFKLPSTTDQKNLSQINSLVMLMNGCWSLNTALRPSAEDCKSNIGFMGPIIPSARNGRGDGDVRPVDLLYGLGELALKNGKADGAMEHFDKALSQSGLSRLIGVGEGGLLDPETIRHAQNDLAKVSHSTAQIARETHDWMKGRLVNSSPTRELGEVQALRIQYNYAEQFHDKARTIHRRTGNQLGIANATLRLRTVQHVQGEYFSAEESYLSAQAIYNEAGDQLGVANSIWGLGEVHYSKNEYSEAESRYTDARDIYDQIGNELGVANATVGLGEIRRLQSQYPDAEALYVKAIGIYSQVGNQLCIANATRRLELVQHVQTEAKADALYLEACALYDEVGDQLSVADATWGLEETQRRQGNYSQAEALYLEAREIYYRIGNRFGVANAIMGLGDVHCGKDEYSIAEALYIEARDIYDLVRNELASGEKDLA